MVRMCAAQRIVISPRVIPGTWFRCTRRCASNGAIASALAQAYEQITYQTLADQVRRSVRSCSGNRWMFRVGQPDEHPIHLHPRLLERESEQALFPILIERTPVASCRLPLTGWTGSTLSAGQSTASATQ